MNEEIFKTIELVDNPVDKEQEKLIFKELFQIEDIQNYIKAIMAADIKRYFVAPKEQQEYIKGGYDRMMQFLMKIQKASSIDSKEEDLT